MAADDESSSSSDADHAAIYEPQQPEYFLQGSLAKECKDKIIPNSYHFKEGFFRLSSTTLHHYKKATRAPWGFVPLHEVMAIPLYLIIKIEEFINNDSTSKSDGKSDENSSPNDNCK
jgi:hypothetical protein